MYDVIIIGAGLAGCYIGREIKDERDVLIIDKSKEVKVDSGIVSTDYDDFLPKSFVKKQIKKISLISENGTEVALRQKSPYAYLLKRKSLSKYLRKNLDIRIETPWKIDIFEDHVHVWTDHGDYKAKMVIGADGANSFTRKQMGIKSPDIYTGVMASAPIRKRRGIDVFLNKNYSESFYAWYIESNGEYGLISKHPKQKFDNLKKDKEFKNTSFYSRPIALGPVKSYNFRSILVGESCGQVKPISGGGIIYTLKSSKKALKAINKALDYNDFFTPFKNYDKHWKRMFKKQMRKQFIFKSIYKRLKNEDINSLLNQYKKDIESWDGFDYDDLASEFTNVDKKKLIKTLLKMPLMLI